VRFNAVKNSACLKDGLLTSCTNFDDSATIPNANLGRCNDFDTDGADPRYDDADLITDRPCYRSAPQLAMPPPHPVTLVVGPNRFDIELRVALETQHLVVSDENGAAVSTDPADNAGALVLRGDDLDALSDDAQDLAADLQAIGGPSAGPGGGTIFVDGFRADSFRPNNRFAKSESIPIRSRRSMTSSAMAASRSSRSPDRTSSTDRWATTLTNCPTST
jgi:hypothetical protein